MFLLCFEIITPQNRVHITNYHLEDMEAEVASLINRISIMDVKTARDRRVKPSKQHYLQWSYLRLATLRPLVLSLESCSFFSEKYMLMIGTLTFHRSFRIQLNKYLSVVCILTIGRVILNFRFYFFAHRETLDHFFSQMSVKLRRFKFQDLA